ncbi:IS4 family transposase [Bradymonas sediminis]|uniref:IS4 family transposase n=2 Tax=Bradymonas sediminis TaxID=1548548 RepID=A0A2Z4FPB4_9DELT|nr:IS4 family transposase [Bradymonas sediminis]
MFMVRLVDRYTNKKGAMMAHIDSKQTLEFLTTFLPDFVIEKYARALGVVVRERKVDPVMLVWTLVLGFPAGSKRTIASLRRRVQQVASITIARSSFHDRLTGLLADLIKRLVDWRLAVQKKSITKNAAKRLDGFSELLALDSTVIGLHQMLAHRWASTQPGQAAAKLHMVTNVVSGTANSVKMTGQTRADIGPWKTVGSWVKNCLLMVDLGYYDFHLFRRIAKKGGFFLSRAKSNANPRIVASHQRVAGNSINLVGQKLQDVLARLERRIIDVEVEVPVKLRKYRGRSRTAKMRMRLVGQKHAETGQYHLYFTNIGPETLGADEIAQTYRLRWQVELLFTRLKTTMRLNQIPSSKPEVVKALIYASILALLLSNAFLQVLRQINPGRTYPAQRMDAVFRDFATVILLHIAQKRGARRIDLFKLMTAEAADPNRNRPGSHDILSAIPLAHKPDTVAFEEVSA